MIRIFSEELRETKRLVLETRNMADAASKQVDASMSKADAAWVLVVITHNQVKEALDYMGLPRWNKFFRTGDIF